MYDKKHTIDPWVKAQLLAKGEPLDVAEEKAIISSSNTPQFNSDRRCPRCRKPLQQIHLVTPKRQALFCSNDNIVIPLPVA